MQGKISSEGGKDPEMTIPQFNNLIENKIQALPTEVLNIGKRRLLNTKAEIEDRIKSTGINADGQPFPPYTPAYQQLKTDVGRYRGHVDLTLGTISINKRIQAVEKRKKRRNKIAQAFGQKGQKLLYGFEKPLIANERRKKNIPKGPELWSNINIKHEAASPTEVMVIVAPLDDFNVKKSDGLAKKRGNFLRPNADESQRLLDGINEDFTNFLQI